MYTTNQNARTKERQFEIIMGESMTVPDMSYTVKKLMEKFVVGNDPHIAHEGDYEDEPNIDGEILDTIQDLTEIDEQRNNVLELQKKVDELNQAKQEKRKKQMETDARELKEYRESKKARQKEKVQNNTEADHPEE